MEIETNFAGLSKEKAKKLQDAIDDQYVEWSMEGEIPEDANDRIFELICEMLNE